MSAFLESLMYKRMKAFLGRLNRNESGAMSVEKILILALVSLPILILLYIFKGTITGWFTTQQDSLTNQVGGNGG